MRLRRPCLLAAVFFITIWSNEAMSEDTHLPPHYAESVMIGLISPEGEREVSIRLARFPEQGIGHVWVNVAAGEGAWSVVDETFKLQHRDATPVTDDNVEFGAYKGDELVRFVSSGRNTGHMEGHVKGTLALTKTRDPQPGPGSIKCLVDLRFKAASTRYRSNEGRWELTGNVTGSVEIGGKRYTFDEPGKWHEQTGPRARFAPAFTYFNVQNDRIALLAIASRGRVNGYALMDGDRLAVKSFRMDPEAPNTRKFKLVLSNEHVIEGTANVVQKWSVPIEGKRRPGATVVVDSNIGRLWGSLNDWEPGVQPTASGR